jgi:F-type H+-transporting ATPase subunit b
MNINATILGQMITFAIFVWFTVKFVWPVLYQALEERRKKISDGLQAAEKGRQDLELAQHRAKEMLENAKQEAQKILSQANKEGSDIVHEAKQKALAVNKHERYLMQQEIIQVEHRLKNKLNAETASLIIDVVSKFLEKRIDKKTDAALVDKLISEIAEA